MKLKNGTALALVVTTGLSATAISLPVLAADTADQPASDTELTEIVVTAEKRAENLQEVPIAVSAFTDKTRDLVGIESLEDISNYTPGVTFNQANDRVNIRGITRSTNNLGIDPGVALYVDGFYRTFNDPVEDSPLFTSQVEILRGPQGTLTGRNAIGGAIEYTSAKPTHDFEGEARATLGNFEERSFEGTFSGPINDWLRFKVLAGDYVQQQGYIQSITGHNNDSLGLRDNQEFQAQLEGNIGTAFDWWIKGDTRTWNEGFGNSVQISPFNTTNAGCTVPGVGTPTLVCPNVLGPNVQYSSGPGLSPAVPGLAQNVSTGANPYITENDTPNRDTLRNDWTYVLQMTGHLSFADIKYIGGFNNYEYDLQTDYDGTNRTSYTYKPLPNPIFNGNSSAIPPVTIDTQYQTLYQELKHFYSNELDLVSTGDSPLQYVLGLYNYHEHYTQPLTVGPTPNPQVQLETPCLATTLASVYLPPPCKQLAAANPSGASFVNNQVTTGQSNAVFGQLDWKIAPTFKATVGLRYTMDRKESDENAREIFWDPTFLGPIALAYDLTGPLLGASGGVNPVPNAQGDLTRHLAIKSNAVTGTGGFDWTPNRDTLVYLSYTRGYKDAGLNSGGLVPFPYVKPEFIDAYEAGSKVTLANRFQVNTSFFYYKYLGAQFPLAVPTARVPINAFFNINEINYGAELETQWAATDNLKFLFNYSYLHARFDDHGVYINTFDINPATGAAGALEQLNGDKVPGAPDHKVAANILYTWQLANGSLAASSSYLWRSSSSSTVFNEPTLISPSYGQVDMRLTYSSASHFQLVGYIRNAFNSAGKDAITGGPAPYDVLSYQLIPPRTYGIEARYRFGDNPL